MEDFGSFHQPNLHENERKTAVANTLAEKLAKLRTIPHVAQAIADNDAKKALELKRRGIPVPSEQRVLRPKTSSLPIPKGQSAKPFSEVDQPELARDGNGDWVQKNLL